ncbi:hypothetical protein FSP39_014513 [Pinctada imbricata]|uniref:Uncharacterized protein n=1 Tax=Pinctada imbricata TaxID=66713 RepID=A0AA88YPC8_PINIB|nr:hypothetical protein FSP39_014513 [Pinctada imbricata]
MKTVSLISSIHSYFQFGGSKLYLAWTTFWALYFPVWLGLDWYWYSPKPAPKKYWIVFLTNLAFLVLCVMVVTEWVIAVYTQCINKDITKNTRATLPWYLKFDWVLNSLSNSTCLVITVAYWVFLWRVYQLRSVNKHGINVIYTLLQVFITSKPIRWQHFYIPVILNITYFIFSVILYAADGHVLYAFLDWRKPARSVPLALLYTFVLIPAFHFAMFGLYKLRLRIFRKKDTAYREQDAEENPEEKPLNMECLNADQTSQDIV